MPSDSPIVGCRMPVNTDENCVKSMTDSEIQPDIAANIARVRERIADAARRTARSPESITLIAVTKTAPLERIALAYAAGIRDFGENYLQEALGKIGQSRANWPDATWHFIGHLQTNKAREVIGPFGLIQSVDSLRLAQELARRVALQKRDLDILLEVKLDPSEAKFGFAPESVLEAAAQVASLENVTVRGLMGMAPFSDTPEQARPYFRTLYQLFQQLPPTCRQVLSMGMTGDFEVAIEEGATHVRIGTAIFGKRQAV